MKYGTCVSCKERLHKGEDRFIIDESKDGGKRNATYCTNCESIARKNNLNPGTVCIFDGSVKMYRVTKNRTYQEIKCS